MAEQLEQVVTESLRDTYTHGLETRQEALHPSIARRNKIFNWTAGITILGTLVETGVYRVANSLGYENIARLADDLFLPTLFGGASAMALSFIYNQTGKRKQEEIEFNQVNNKLAEIYEDW